MRHCGRPRSYVCKVCKQQMAVEEKEMHHRPRPKTENDGKGHPCEMVKCGLCRLPFLRGLAKEHRQVRACRRPPLEREREHGGARLSRPKVVGTLCCPCRLSSRHTHVSVGSVHLRLQQSQLNQVFLCGRVTRVCEVKHGSLVSLRRVRNPHPMGSLTGRTPAPGGIVVVLTDRF